MLFSKLFLIKQFFKTINYQLDDKLDMDVIMRRMLKVILKCDDLFDVHKLLKSYQFVLRKEKKINRMLKGRKAYKLDLSDFEYPMKIDYKNNPSIHQTIFYTNVLSNKMHKFVRYDSERQEVKHLDIKKKRLDVSTNCRFHLIHKTAKVFIRNDAKEEIMQMTYKKSSFVLKHNKTTYDIVHHNDEIHIVDESKQLVAVINVDLLKAYAMVGTVMIDLFDQQDVLIDLMAIGMLLLMCDQSMMQMSAVMIVT